MFKKKTYFYLNINVDKFINLAEKGLDDNNSDFFFSGTIHDENRACGIDKNHRKIIGTRLYKKNKNDDISIYLRLPDDILNEVYLSYNDGSSELHQMSIKYLRAMWDIYTDSILNEKNKSEVMENVKIDFIEKYKQIKNDTSIINEEKQQYHKDNLKNAFRF